MSLEPPSPSAAEVGSGLCWNIGTGEEEESRSDNQEQEDIDGTGEVEH